MRVLCLVLVLAATASAGEYVTFASGSRLRIERHEGDGSKVHLYTGAAEVVVDASQVRGFEAEDAPPVPDAPATAPAVDAGTAGLAQGALDPADLADAAADKYGLPRPLVRSVMAAESAMNPLAVSPKGAIGLMQLMPSTAKTLSADPYDPAQNVDAGARYLRDLLLQYGGKLWHALAAYNAGPGAVDRYHGLPPYRETIAYILRVDGQTEKVR